MTLRSLPLPHALYKAMYLEVIAVPHYRQGCGAGGGAPEPAIFGGAEAGAAFEILLEPEPELFSKVSWSRSRSWWLI